MRTTRHMHCEPHTEPTDNDASLLRALRDRTAENALAGESKSGVSRSDSSWK